MVVLRHAAEGMDVIEIPGFAVNYKDVFNMQYIYHVLHEWMIENGWATRDDSEFGERDYIQRENPSFGKEIWVRWRFFKDPPAEDPFIQYKLNIDMHAIGLKEVETVINNKKVKADKCELDIACALHIVVNYEKYTKGTFLQKYRNLIIDKLYHKKIDYHKREAYREGRRLQEAIKEYLKLHKYGHAVEFEGLWNKTVREYPKQ